MATLSAGIKTKVETLVAAVSRKEVTNPRDPSASAQADAVMTAACDSAAAVVQEYLGDDRDSTDAAAVDIGARLALLDLQGTWNMTLGDKPVTGRQIVMAELNRMRARRVAEIDLEVASPATGQFDAINARFYQDWEDANA